MDYKELSKKVKQKYPGSYDDMDDLQLAQKIVKKYPEYSDVTFPDQPKQKTFDETVDTLKEFSGFNTTPVGVASNLYENISKGFNRAGEFVTEELSKPRYRRNTFTDKVYDTGQIPAKLAAGIGTLVQMTPDIVMSAGMPSETSFGKPGAVAKNLSRRHLGLSKRFLGTPFARGQADKAASVALEENLISSRGNPEVTYSNALNLAEKSGKKIGQTLEKTTVNIGDVFDDLERFRTEVTGGLKEGVYSKINNVVDDVQKSLIELSDKGDNISASAINKVKNKLVDSVNFFTEAAKDKKAVARGLADSIRGLIKRLNSPEDFKEFLNNQRLYNSAQVAMSGLNNEISAQLGNKVPSLISTGFAAGQLATGNLPKALATMGITEFLLKAGLGLGAKAAHKFGKVGYPAAIQGSLGFLRKKKNENK